VKEFDRLLQEYAIKNQMYGNLSGCYYEFYEGSLCEETHKKKDALDRLSQELMDDKQRLIDHVYSKYKV
jgi:hypothetical protein